VRSGAPGDRQEEAGELDEESIDESGKSCPGRSSPPGSPPLRSVGRPTRRSVGGRVSGPGDGAPKHPSLREPTQSDHAEGHGGGPNNVGVDLPLSPGSWSSARLHMPHAREPGDLGGCPPPVVGGGQPREGNKPDAAGAPKAQPFEESDAGVVPEKSAKTWVTPVEPMEERPKAKGKLVQRNASRTLGRQDATTHLERVGPQEEEGGGTTTGRLTTDGPRSTCASVDPRWEPGAGNPLAGLCPGGGPSRPSRSGGRRRAVPTGTARDGRPPRFPVRLSVP
jgi:hypothetical protein